MRICTSTVFRARRTVSPLLRPTFCFLIPTSYLLVRYPSLRAPAYWFALRSVHFPYLTHANHTLLALSFLRSIPHHSLSLVRCEFPIFPSEDVSRHTFSLSQEQ